MAIRTTISFKENVEEISLYNFFKEKSQIIGESAYIKMLIHEAKKKEEMIQENKEKEQKK
ncbi:MAG: hypothetical protein N4A54_04050 [Peptostreptococcaceae bacterium]|jgi:hypothetical protein|nr:hypothetical protein [Peptostreptococcaceae bacterium]